jgi:Zn finger protein HypA/HybF involved in hydrogenase expression
LRTDILEKKELILSLIEDNATKAEICRELNCKASTLESYLIKMNIDYSGNKGAKGRKISNMRTSSEYYTSSNIIVGSHILKNKLIEDNVKEHKCESCDSEEWMGVKIPIELHHIDGNRFNNKLENLQILCPNCHAITDNYSGKNKAKKESELKPLRNIKPKKIKKCICGKIIKSRSNSCIECNSIQQRKTDRPTIEQIEIDVKELGYKGTGRKYGVSDNSIRKWLKI